MRIQSMIVALLAVAAGGTSAWAKGAAGAVSGAPATTSTAASTTAATTAAATSANLTATGSAASTNASTLPPPPPASLNPTLSSHNTVPPTPAPATAGLPSNPPAAALPSQQGLPASVQNELRPSPSLSVDQVASVQASLAAGGLYRGPIDGNMSATLRASIRSYQQISALPQTGILDAETMARLTRSTLIGGTGSNGTTSTTGNLNVTQPFSTTVTVVPGTSSTAATTTPFSLSSPINTSPNAPAGVVVQP